jgi:hypothetical protein
MINKIPLQPLIQILQNLYDDGADYIDIKAKSTEEGEQKRDVVTIIVKPEYISEDSGAQEIEIDYSDDEDDIINEEGLSDEDINDLI